ncbi:hypothetical protein B296_00041082 [Ensete ventricosum]|uniref:Uncharacterized protein n=1 Tax=Ensete ventricosum TaxID=4639 RepID=A0A426YFY5_ENSVE|nr:hypothetical protein B296_00041082 [Ensete ventricosum]
MVNLPNLTQNILLLQRYEGLKEMQKEWGEGATMEQYCHGSLCLRKVKVPKKEREAPSIVVKKEPQAVELPYQLEDIIKHDILSSNAPPSGLQLINYSLRERTASANHIQTPLLDVLVFRPTSAVLCFSPATREKESTAVVSPPVFSSYPWTAAVFSPS